MSLKARLKEFTKTLGTGGHNAFEEKVGMARGHVSNVGDSLREVTLKKIAAGYPELNIAWLLTGEGEMLKPAQAESKLYSQKTVETKIVERDQEGINEGFRDKYYRLLENNNDKIQNLIEKVVRALDNINDMNVIIKSQQETIRDLTSAKRDSKAVSM